MDGPAYFWMEVREQMVEARLKPLKRFTLANCDNCARSAVFPYWDQARRLHDTHVPLIDAHDTTD